MAWLPASTPLVSRRLQLCLWPHWLLLALLVGAAEDPNSGTCPEVRPLAKAPPTASPWSLKVTIVKGSAFGRIGGQDPNLFVAYELDVGSETYKGQTQVLASEAPRWAFACEFPVPYDKGLPPVQIELRAKVYHRPAQSDKGDREVAEFSHQVVLQPLDRVRKRVRCAICEGVSHMPLVVVETRWRQPGLVVVQGEDQRQAKLRQRAIILVCVAGAFLVMGSCAAMILRGRWKRQKQASLPPASRVPIMLPRPTLVLDMEMALPRQRYGEPPFVAPPGGVGPWASEPALGVAQPSKPDLATT